MFEFEIMKNRNRKINEFIKLRSQVQTIKWVENELPHSARRQQLLQDLKSKILISTMYTLHTDGYIRLHFTFSEYYFFISKFNYDIYDKKISSIARSGPLKSSKKEH